MIFEAQRYSLVMEDLIYSMGAGFMTGVVYQLLSLLFYKNKVAVFIKDVLISCFFATALFSFVVSFANYKVLRWYNIVMALLGWLTFTPSFSNGFHSAVGRLSKCVKSKLIKVYTVFHKKLLTKMQKKVERFHEKTQKNQTEVLKETKVILYN